MRLARLSAWLLLPVIPAVLSGCHSRSTPPSPGDAPQQTQAPPAPPMKPAPPTPLDEKKAELGSSNTWQPQWDAFIEQSLPADLLSAKAARAVHTFCPAFAQMKEADQRAFWAYTLQALAAAEAGLKPTADVHHTQPAVNHIDHVSHRPIRQEGLLQLTYEDAQRYGCDFDYKADAHLPEKSPQRTILDPQRNLGCGMRILDNQISTADQPLVSRHSYWATLQPGTRSYRVFAKQMANVPPACGLRAAHSQRRGR